MLGGVSNANAVSSPSTESQKKWSLQRQITYRKKLSCLLHWYYCGTAAVPGLRESSRNDICVVKWEFIKHVQRTKNVTGLFNIPWKIKQNANILRIARSYKNPFMPLGRLISVRNTCMKTIRNDEFSNWSVIENGVSFISFYNFRLVRLVAMRTIAYVYDVTIELQNVWTVWA